MTWGNGTGEGLVNNVITDYLDRLIELDGSTLGLQSDRAPVLTIRNKDNTFEEMPIMSHEELVEDMQALGVALEYQPYDLYTHTRDNNEKVTFLLSCQDLTDEGFGESFTLIFMRQPDDLDF